MSRTTRVLLLAAGFLCGAMLLLGQPGQPKPKPALAQQATQAKPPAPSAAPAQAQTTELEKTQLENIQLRMMLLEDEERSIPERKQQLQTQYGALIQQIQREHPGFVWNPQTATLIPVPKPEEKKTR